jgi:hypothetical protein
MFFVEKRFGKAIHSSFGFILARFRAVIHDAIGLSEPGYHHNRFSIECKLAAMEGKMHRFI